MPKEEASSHLVTLPDEGDPLDNQASLTGGASDSARGASATATAAAFQVMPSPPIDPSSGSRACAAESGILFVVDLFVVFLGLLFISFAFGVWVVKKVVDPPQGDEAGPASRGAFGIHAGAELATEGHRLWSALAETSHATASRFSRLVSTHRSEIN